MSNKSYLRFTKVEIEVENLPNDSHLTKQDFIAAMMFVLQRARCLDGVTIKVDVEQLKPPKSTRPKLPIKIDVEYETHDVLDQVSVQVLNGQFEDLMLDILPKEYLIDFSSELEIELRLQGLHCSGNYVESHPQAFSLKKISATVYDGGLTLGSITSKLRQKMADILKKKISSVDKTFKATVSKRSGDHPKRAYRDTVVFDLTVEALYLEERHARLICMELFDLICKLVPKKHKGVISVRTTAGVVLCELGFQGTK